MTRDSRLSWRLWALVSFVAIVWGGAYAANRVALDELPFFEIATIRYAGAALVLWFGVYRDGAKIPSDAPTRVRLFLVGILANIAPTLLLVWAQQYVPSGVAGILNTSVVLVTVILAARWLPDEPLTLRRFLGVLIGIAGVALTVGPQSLSASGFAGYAQGAILVGSSCYAVSTIVTRVRLAHVPPSLIAAIGCTIAFAIALPLAMSVGTKPRIPRLAASWLALAYLAFVAQAGGYLLVYRLLPRIGAGNMNLANMMTGAVAVVAGTLLFHEVLSWHAYVGLGVVILGLAVIDGRLLACARPSPTSSSTAGHGDGSGRPVDPTHR